MKASIRREAVMSTAEVTRRRSRRTWWVRREGPVAELDRFVDTGRKLADVGLDVELEPGEYTIGAGEPQHYRERITVHEDGSVTSDRDAMTAVAPCLTRGCDGTVDASDESKLEAVGPDDDPPRSRLCAACEGDS